MKAARYICTIVIALSALTPGRGFADEASAAPGHSGHHAAGAMDARQTGQLPKGLYRHFPNRNSAATAAGLTMGVRRGQFTKMPTAGESIAPLWNVVHHRGANAPIIGGLTALGARRSTAMISGADVKRKP